MDKRFRYTGQGLDLAWIMLTNFIFTFLTLGIYYPWALTKVRKFIVGNTEFLGEKCRYTGTGEELFWGWVKLFAIYIVGSVILTVVFAILFFLPFGSLVATLAGYTLYVAIIGLATYSGTRYRLSRTRWKNLGFGLRGNTKEFAKIFFIGALLTAVTFGIYYPFFYLDIRRFLTKSARIGNQHFDFDGDSFVYFKIFAKGFVFSILTLGIYIPFMIKNLYKYRFNHTKFGSAFFEFDLDPQRLLFFAIVSWLALVMTFGLAIPFVLNHYYYMFINATSVSGDVDPNQISDLASSGDAMMDDLAIGYNLDIGF